MTKQEFFEAQKKSRQEYLILQRRTAREIHTVYVQSADEVAKIIKQLEISNRGASLTADSYRELQRALTKTARDISRAIDPTITGAIAQQTQISGAHHFQFINDALSASGLSSSRVSVDTLSKMFAAINTRMVELTYTRVVDGYNFVDRVGFLRKNWNSGVESVITSGIAQNRDVIKIAADLQKYARSGRAGLVNRYGEIVRGTKKFIKRIPKNLDYRALLLARSELYISLQNSQKVQGLMNPAVRYYDWNLTSGAAHVCICPDLAADSPYLYNDIPDFPHSNCLCYITHQLISRDEFANDLTYWGSGIGVPYLDSWYQDVYLPFNVSRSLPI
jgi:hypothetical protein